MLVQLFIWMCEWPLGVRSPPGLDALSTSPAVSEEEGVMDIKTNLQMLAAIASFAVLAAVVCGQV